MNLLDFKDTRTITKTYALLQKFSFITTVILCLGAVITAIILAFDGSFELIPIAGGAVILFIFVQIIISKSLKIKFGLYYDIRVLRLVAENNNNITTNDDTLPEL